jgi:4-alpha-glucanotransferase
MTLSPEKKIAGVLTPLFALRRGDDLGIGDLGALREFIDWIAAGGFRLVQLLPINETGGDNSPYNAISSRAIEPTTLHLAPGSPQHLTQERFEAAVGTIDLGRIRRGAVKYRQVRKLKRSLLEAAYQGFTENAATDARGCFEQFCRTEAEWLDDYTLFRVLMEENGGSEAWDQWQPHHQSRDDAVQWATALPAERRAWVEQRRSFFGYVQWIAHEQWREVRSYASSRGVALMGDIPFGVSYYSADVFSRPNEFELQWFGGAPPEPYFKDDEFTVKWGQNWGIPVYNWAAMRGNGLAWWRQRVRGVRDIFDLFRIDHVLGFYRIYAFPWRPTRNEEFLSLEWQQMLEKTGGRAPHFAPRDDTTAESREANRREGEDYLRIVLDESRDTRVVGEDLGTVPDYVRPSLQSLGIAGFKIPQWESRHDQVIPGSEYERVSVATYATHDHKPVLAIWHDAVQEQTAVSDQAKGDLGKIAQFAGLGEPTAAVDYERDLYPAIMRALFESNSWVAVVMLTDLMARKYRFNVPGTATGSNWTRRMEGTVEQWRTSRKEQRRMRIIRHLLEKSGRV